MDGPLTNCPGCGKWGYEWIAGERVGWCIYCGYYEYHSNIQEYYERSRCDEPEC